MFHWLLVIILAYLFFGLASLCDKLVLGDGAKKPFHPVTYTFYVGVFGLLSVFLIPFINFSFPDIKSLGWIIFESVSRTGAIFAMYHALKKFDVSRVMPAIGAIQTIFVFILSIAFWGAHIISETNMFAFALLFLGSIIISFAKNLRITAEFLKIIMLSSFLFSLEYISLKMVFLRQPFLQGIVWIAIFNFLIVLLFLLRKSFRKKIFEKQAIANKKNQIFFLGAQGCGGLGILLQNFAISLAPVAVLPTMNALRGMQYAFLFLMTIFVSFVFPSLLKEELSKQAIFQKTVSILFIIAGLALLVA